MDLVDQKEINRLEADHQEQERELDDLRSALTRSSPDFEAAVDIVIRLDADLSEHLKKEEEEYFPFLSTLLEGDDLVLDQLAREHIELMLEMTLLRLGLERNPRPPDILSRALEFAQFFENHARLEQHLLREAMQRQGIARRGDKPPSLKSGERHGST